MKQTINYNLVKPELTDSPPDITVMNPNWDKVDEKLKEFEEENENIGDLSQLQTTEKSNIVNSINEVFQSVSDGKTLVAGAITDKGVNTSPTDTFQTMADNIEDIETDPSIGTTDAVAGDILSGKKVVSQGNLLTGTMPNRGAVNQNLTTEGQGYTIPAGYHNGLGKVKAAITGLMANVIKAGATVGGVLGTFTADATAITADILSGYTAYANGNKITGTIPSKTAQTYTPGTTNQVINSGQYLLGNQTILGSANLVPENIKKGVNIFGIVGTYLPIPRKTLVTFTSSTSWTVPTSCYEIEVYMIGGGAGGQAGTPGQITGYTSGGGGASGRIYSGVFPIISGVLNITVGAGGAAQSYSTSMTYNGTNSTITGAITASTASGSQASAVSGTTNQVGANGRTLSTNFPSELQQAVYGGGAGGGLYKEDGRAGGTSAGGGNGGYGQDSSNPTGGSPATLYGCGGGGGGRNYRAVSPSGGAGKSGIVYIYYLSIE